MRTIVLLLGLCSVPALAADAAAETFSLKDGAECAESKTVMHDGETHRCIFEPKAFAKRDFTSRNGRAQYIFSKLGPDCDTMEILADEPYADSPDAGAPLRRVSVLCEE